MIGELAIRLLVKVPPVHAIWIDDDNSFYRRSTNAILNYRIKPGFKRMTSVGQATSNRHGFRDLPRETTKPAGVRRILLLGDSVVEGINYVDDENTLSRHLQRLYPDGKTEVLNFGTSGYCTLAEVTLLREKGLAFKPDLVLLVFVENDYDNFNPEHTVAGGVKDRPTWAKHLFVGSHLYRFLSLRFNWFDFAEESDPAARNGKALGLNNVVTGLRLLRELANENNFEVMIVPWPWFDDLLIGHPDSPDGKPLVIERLAAMNGLPIRRIDKDFTRAWKSLSPLPNPLTHFTVKGDGMHPNNAAAAVAAQIFKTIVDQAIPAPPYQSGPPDAEAVELASLRSDIKPITSRSTERRIFRSLMYQARIEEAQDFLLQVIADNPTNSWQKSWANGMLDSDIFHSSGSTNQPAADAPPVPGMTGK